MNSFSETHQMSDAIVTETYVRALLDLTGKINNAPFRGILPGECLFCGALFPKNEQGKWIFVFHFASELLFQSNPNSDGQASEDMWQPVALGLAKLVYEKGDFADLAIGTGRQPRLTPISVSSG